MHRQGGVCTPLPMLPAIRTSRLFLRPATLSHIDELWQLWRDPDVRRFLWDDRQIARDEARRVVADLAALNDTGLGLWVAERVPRGDSPATPAFLGCAALFPVSTAAEHEPALAGMVEPLIALAPRAWGNGYAVEALGALVSYAFETLALPALAGVTDVPNVASDRMLRRAGFIPLSEVSGPRHPLRIYRLERSSSPAR